MSLDTGKACSHCGALVFEETKKCPQCGRFPVALHLCPACKTISERDSQTCPKCGRPLQPEGDFL